MFGNGKECREECGGGGGVAMLRQNNRRSITFAFASLTRFTSCFLTPSLLRLRSDRTAADWKSIGDHRQFIYCNRASRNEEEEEEEEEKKEKEKEAGKGVSE